MCAQLNLCVPKCECAYNYVCSQTSHRRGTDSDTKVWRPGLGGIKLMLTNVWTRTMLVGIGRVIRDEHGQALAFAVSNFDSNYSPWWPKLKRFLTMSKFVKNSCSWRSLLWSQITRRLSTNFIDETDMSPRYWFDCWWYFHNCNVKFIYRPQTVNSWSC